MEGSTLEGRRAIVTITIGDKFWAVAEHTHSLLRRYAESCHAEFVVLSKPRLSHRLKVPHYERFQLFELLDKYERLLFVDSDILVSPDSPCLFDLVPTGMMGVASEEMYSMSKRDKEITQEILGKVDWQNPYFNSGVMLVSRQHKQVFDSENPDLHLWATGAFRSRHHNLLNDQPFLNHRVNKLGIRILDLGHRFNHTRVITPTHKRFQSYFIHYAGPSGHRYGTRSEQLRKDKNVLTSYFLLKLSRRFPLYRWVADRMDPAFIKYLVTEKINLQK